jgi:hypothetical protein
MHITSEELDQMLDDGGYTGLESDDLLDWEYDLQSSLVADYLTTCSSSSKLEIMNEIIERENIDVLNKLRTNPQEFITSFNDAADTYVKSAIREEVMESIERINSYYAPFNLADHQISMMH